MEKARFPFYLKNVKDISFINTAVNGIELPLHQEEASDAVTLDVY